MDKDDVIANLECAEDDLKLVGEEIGKDHPWRRYFVEAESAVGILADKVRDRDYS